MPISDAAWLLAYWEYSTDAGATWVDVGTWRVDTYYTRHWADDGQVAGTGLMAPPMALDAGTTYRFELFLSGIGASCRPHHVPDRGDDPRRQSRDFDAGRVTGHRQHRRIPWAEGRGMKREG